MAFTIAIVGRPNVGKSTLFNRLLARRAALVDYTPGLTRDRREAEGQLGDLRLRVVDTAGLEEASAKTLEGQMRAQTERAVRGAEAVLFMIDARAGVTALDRHFANWLRRLGRPTLLLANKAESTAGAASGIAEAHGLGLGAPIAISAEHGEGLAELHAALKRLAPAEAILPGGGDAQRDGDGAAASERPIRVAVVGRPNVGKSTLVNRLLGEERVLTGPEPGITRDAIEVPWRWKGRPFVLVDTAGLRRKARIDDPLERKSTHDALRAIRAAQVVILVLDGALLLERQDLAIARLAAEEGRALVLAVNKWDLVDAPQNALRRLRDRIEISLPQIKGVRFATVSALHGRKLDELMGAVIQAYDTWNREVPTPKLNRWLEAMNEAHPPPMVGGRRPRLRFMRQASARPPTFAIFGSKLTTLPDDYLRYLANGLRKTFGLDGCVIRIQLRQSTNPFERR